MEATSAVASRVASFATLDAADFAFAQFALPLAGNEIHLWFYPCVDTTAASDVRQKVIRLLAAYAGCDETAIHWERGPFGKPHLVSRAELTLPQFNLSHSGAALMLAVSAQEPVGVDVEAAGRKRDWLALANRFFANEESRALTRLHDAVRESGFLSLWTCKEAVLKALGRGIAFGLHRLQFEMDETGAATSLREIAVEAGPRDAWNLTALRPAPGIYGALAWRGAALRVRAFRGNA